MVYSKEKTYNSVGKERGMDLGGVGLEDEYDQTHCMEFSEN